MNRLVRIAVTLFASASVMIFLVLKRLARAKVMTGAESVSEIQMAYVGLGVVGLMLVAGLVLVIVAIVRSRKKDHG
jgi:hypothetical protein